MRQVVLLRNVNQGQRGHPSTADIRSAFADAGYPAAMPFQSNGTVVLDARTLDDVVVDVPAALAVRSGAGRDAFGMSLAQLARIVDAHAGAPDASRRELTLHSGGALSATDPDVVREAAHRRCEIVDSGDGWVVSLNERDGESNATPAVERITGMPATSRGLPTLVRLLDRFGTPA